MKTMDRGRASLLARLSRYLSTWIIALPTTTGLVVATALAVIYKGGGSIDGWRNYFTNLSLLQMVAVMAAACCVCLAASEGRAQPLKLRRLAGPPLLVALVAIILLSVGGASRQPVLMSSMALATGLLVGAVRGLTMRLQIDHMWNLILLSRTPDALCVALLVTLAVAISVGGVFAGPSGASYSLAATAISMLCAGVLTGRSVAVTVRSWHSPHVDLVASQLLF
jgi:hypothetical protein